MIDWIKNIFKRKSLSEQYYRRIQNESVEEDPLDSVKIWSDKECDEKIERGGFDSGAAAYIKAMNQLKRSNDNESQDQ
jgi:hypothetical protein